MPDLPTGTVTFLFTDIEASTRLVAQLGDDYAGVLEIHNAILRRAISAAGGIDLATQGDAFFAVFTEATDAVHAAVAAQRGLAGYPWPSGVRVNVRMGMHTGEATIGGDNYVGLSVHRASRIADAAHGGQVLLSAVTAPLVRQALPDDVSLRDLGEHWLKDLERPEPIFQLLIAGRPADFPPLRAAAGRPLNLPVELTAFVGRDAELTEIDRLLDRARLVTLVGPGGTGKTRLAIRAAERAAGRFADGVAFVPLAPVVDAELLPSAISAALGLRQDPAVPVDELVREHLRPRRMLVVTDNLEQIAGAGAYLGRLMIDAPDLRILATSRAPLHVGGEQQFPVPPMGLPEGHGGTADGLRRSEAVALFIARAREVDPSFELTDANAADVAAICTRLDGLPLAMELAAARIAVLTPAAMLTRLDRPLELLRSAARDVPERQRTLRATIAWSFDLLDEAEQRLFSRLSVFVGGWTLDAAAAIAAGEEGETLDLLAALVDHSLVRRADRAGEPHFEMLETIREFAGNQLGARPEESVDAHRRHATHWLESVERVAPTLELESDAALRLAADQDNLRAALRFALGGGPGPAAPTDIPGDADLGLRLVVAMGRFWMLNGAREGSAWLERAIAVASSHPALVQAEIYFWSGVLLDLQFREEEAERCLAESLDRFRALGDRRWEARLLNSLGVVARSRGELERSRSLLNESLAIRAEKGQTSGIATVLNNLAVVDVDEGDLEAARGHLERALELERAAGNLEGVATSLGNLAGVALRAGETERAEPLVAASLRDFVRIGDTLGIAEDLEHAAEAAAQRGLPERAARLYGAAETVRGLEGLRMTDVDAARYRSIVEGVRAALGPTAYAAAFAAGGALTREAAVEEALKGLVGGPPAD